MSDMKEKQFPIQTQRDAPPHPLLIPWEIAELAYSVYASRYGQEQSLGHLAARGGFGPGEMDMFVPGWRGMCSHHAEVHKANAALRTENAQLHAQLDALQGVVDKLPREDDVFMGLASIGSVDGGKVVFMQRCCQCDPEVGMSPCEYCAIHYPLAKMLQIAREVAQQESEHEQG